MFYGKSLKKQNGLSFFWKNPSITEFIFVFLHENN